MTRLFLLFSITVFLLLPAEGLELHPLFSNHAVLQQDKPIPIWGTAEPGEEVTVEFSGRKVSGRADEDGDWMLVLAPLPANAGPSVLKVSAASDSISIEGVLVGEVWIASGQSNMAMAVKSTFDAEETARKVEQGAFKNVRLFRAPVKGSDARAETVEAAWSLPTASAVERFSAVAFFFGAKLSGDRSVPVGLIQAANGGTNAFSWINTETFQSDPAAETVRSYWAAALKNLPASRERYEAALSQFKTQAKEAKAKGVEFKRRAPRAPLGPDHVKRPTGHYNAMVAPLQPYAIRGTIWYQGEANSRVPFYSGYKDLMFALVEDWRDDWAAASGGIVEREDFPFYLVQLPNYAGGSPEGWPAIREQMLQFWQEGENTGMVVSIDKGEAGDIHPRDKKPVGERLAQFARAETYGENLVFSGPVYETILIKGAQARLSFAHVGGGLASADGGELRHFEIAGADQKFVPAKAVIDGEGLIVTSEQVSEPRAVRYAWSSNPEGVNFTNKEGLPASPFRTDSW